jgi:hypothetical protein
VAGGIEEEKGGEGGRRETVRRVVEGAEAHKAYKASWMERWMSRNGLEQQPKWMEVLLKGGAKLMSDVPILLRHCASARA